MAAVLPVAVLLIFLVVFGANAADNTTDNATPEVPAVVICNICKCKEEGLVDCRNLNLTTFFRKEDWETLTDFKPVRVDLSENVIINVTEVPALPIEVLNLSNNKISYIETAAFRALAKLRALDLSGNYLTSEKLSPHAFQGNYSPEEYEPLPSFRALNLADNGLHSLSADLFMHISDLEELDLSRNPFQQLDHVSVIAIASLQMLKVLRLHDCDLEDIPDRMLHTPRFLERLDLSKNQLTSVPQELDEAINLVYLNLNENPIITLDDESGFPRLRKLKELHMSNMPKLRSIGVQTLGPLEGLTKLYLSNNPRLAYIHQDALARSDEIAESYIYPPIKELYLQHNNLSEIDPLLIPRWENLEKLNVSNNPYLCDCSTQWMVDNLVTFVERTGGNASYLVCQEPIEMRGYTMAHLHQTHRTMRCVDKYGNRPERDGAILMGVLIGVLLSVPIMLSLVLLWRRNYFSCLGLRGPVEVSRAFYKRAPVEDNYM